MKREFEMAVKEKIELMKKIEVANKQSAQVYDDLEAEKLTTYELRIELDKIRKLREKDREEPAWISQAKSVNNLNPDSQTK